METMDASGHMSEEPKVVRCAFNPEVYTVDSNGIITNVVTGNKLTPTTPEGAYPIVSILCSDGKTRTVSVHSIVIRSFVGPRPHGMIINHKDGYKENFTLGNLEYITQSANVRHAIDTGLTTLDPHTKPVLQLNKETDEVIAEYHSVADAAEAIIGNRNLSGHICNACLGRCKTAYGFKWRYKHDKPNLEEYKPLFGGRYQVSKDGNIYSSVRTKLLKPSPGVSGYLRVCVRPIFGEKAQMIPVHKLVAMAWLGNIPEGYQIDHKDRCVTNNHVDNLRIVTAAENAANKVLKSQRAVAQIKDGNILRIFDSATEAAKYVGVDNSCIINCCRGCAKKSVGYEWKYADDKQTRKPSKGTMVYAYNIESNILLTTYPTIVEASRTTGITYSTLRGRIRKSTPIDGILYTTKIMG